MQPSSLIFLILIAIWAAYLLQHWVRRREHLATARSVDRFSLAMRVLERRTLMPGPEPSELRSRSQAMSPARPSHSEVDVTRVQSMNPDVPVAPPATVRPTRIFHVLAGVSARRVRGASLLVSLFFSIVVLSLAAFSAVPWWSVPVVVAVLVGDVAWLRHMAVSGRASDRGRSGGSVDRAPVHFGHLGAEPDSGAEVESPSDLEPADAAPLGAAEVAEPTPSPFEPGPSGWTPVPVPPPTYTLKAQAAGTMAPAPGPTTASDPDRDHESAGPWSLDGMVYDCELDDLVERHSATGA